MANTSLHNQSHGPVDESGIRLCKTSPQFLASNATSHTWAFSAVAELIDNAYDPDVRATQIRIDYKIINGQSCLVFIDDGNGLNEDQLYRMLSFGYSDKPETLEYKPIGRYGNGFKSGSMRLGKDTMVLTKQKDTLSVGLLSQTFHERINADTVLIPIVTFNRETLDLAEPVDENDRNLQAILKHSIFTTADELMDQLTVIPDFDSTQANGTKIIIWNLRELGHGIPELEFRSDLKDIVLNNPDAGPSAAESESMGFEHSLRKYCSILYLRPRMKIYIMDEKIRSRLITKDLCRTEHDKYTMRDQRPLVITFGFNPSRGRANKSNDYGVMMYHKNRLIKAYEKVGYQKQATGQGYGVVGVLEADFLTPNHNKQDFNPDDKLLRVMNALAKKLNEYWDAKMGQRTQEDGNVKAEFSEPDCNWVQCDQCLKWRRLPPGETVEDEENWYCVMHPSDEVNTAGCRAPEDKLDENEFDLRTPSNYRQEKKKAANKKRKTSTYTRSRTSFVEQEEEEEHTRPKRRCVQETPRAALVTDVRRKIDQLNRQTQSLLAEAPVAVGDIADALHQDRERGRENEDSRPVLCVRCHAWKKLPVEAQVDNENEWECSMHPDEKERQCQDFVYECDSDSRSSPITDEVSNRGTPNPNDAGPSGLQNHRLARQYTRSVSVEVDARTSTPAVALDESEEDDEENGEDIRNIQNDVEKLAATVETLQQELTKRSAKPEVSAVGIQTEAQERNGNAPVAKCEECEGAVAQLMEARRDVAQLLTIILEEGEIRPENAFATVKMMLKNSMNNKE